jgi:cell division protease FtsH
MITKYGMSENLGNLIFGNENDEIFIGRDFAQARNYSEEVAATIDKEVKGIIDTAYERTITLLKENMNKLHNVATALLEKEKLEGAEFEEIFANA